MYAGFVSSILIAVSLFILLPFSTAGAEGPLNLAAGARGKLCLECHETFKETMKKPFVHTPLKNGECTGCHNPHGSDHGQLLAANPSEVCYLCHDTMATSDAKSSHQVVLEGQCILCHDPHSAENRMNLVRKGSELCFGCHEDLGKSVADNKFPHSPVQQDCLKCHNAHSSPNGKLLTAEAPGLCTECHQTGKASFKSVHMDYPVEKSNCVSCHDPHGSSTAAMLFDQVHEPVGKRMCKQCHNDPTAADPFALKQAGYQVCQGCHYEMMNETLGKDRLHWPLADSRGCANCHSPHASPVSGLLKKPMIEVCGSCHADTVARQARSETKHPPIAEGECAACHSPHASDYEFMLKNETNIELCGTCHEWQSHSTHPIGEDYQDPRNKNLTLQCLTCHRSHGTEYKNFLYYETTNDLCVQCHTKYRR